MYDQVYVYTAVFSPTKLNTTIIHEWQHRKPDSNEWVTVSTISLPLIGGREGGFRTFSFRDGLEAGLWRVNVETPTGHTLGTIRFEVVEGEAQLVTTYKP